MGNHIDKEELVVALVDALQDERVISAFIQAVAAGKIAQAKVDKAAAWKEQLEASGLALAADIDADELAKLYPLSLMEIAETVQYLKTEERDGEISQDDISKAIIVQLGSNRLAGRLETIRMKSVSPLAEVFSASTKCSAAYEACGAIHACGQPYHCGPDFQCGTPFECGWRFENFSCVSSDIHCSHHQHNMDE